jgi:uncharacterized RDD family membrane protein YckC
VAVTRRATTDPTAVVARRGGAWFIDGVLCALAGAIPALLLADAFELNRSANGFDVERHGDDVALFVRDTVVVLTTSELAITVGAFAAAVLLLLVVLPGRRGWSPGYLAADVRLVRRDGERAGIVRALVRTVLWVVDILPGIPLVAYGSARMTERHQRVGDLVARTYVVDKRAVGRPIDQPVEAADDLTPVVETAPEPLPDEAEEVPVDDDDAEATWQPDDFAPEPGPDPEPEATPVAAAAAVTPAPDGVPADEPIWDRRNKRYVLWHSKAGRWLTHTDAGWAPFEQHPAEDARPEG